jgi:iron-sulfur cluster assembly accessory protein
LLLFSKKDDSSFSEEKEAKRLLFPAPDRRDVGMAKRRGEPYLGAMSFTVSDQALARVAEIIAAEGRPSALRVAVLAGGCSGFQYKFDLDETVQDDDYVVERGQARVVVDPTSLDLLQGAELHYADELMGSYFTVRNPNATSACGCGSSFSID